MEAIKTRLKGMGLTDSTIKTYCSILKQFFEHSKKVTGFQQKEIEDYLDYLMVVRNYSGRSRNLVMKVIRFYCREFIGQELNLRKAKENKPIPKVCWDEDFTQIMSVTRNIKHRLCLLLMRYSGLRRCEVIRVMRHDILQDGRLMVRQGKGQKDRVAIIPQQVKDLLMPYIELLLVDNPYIFQSQDCKGHYNPRTPEQILVNAFRTLGWHRSRWFGCHALRHAFTIYALDNKIGDLDEVSKWLGHSAMRTSQIYTQCRKTKYTDAISKYNQITCIIQ